MVSLKCVVCGELACYVIHPEEKERFDAFVQKYGTLITSGISAGAAVCALHG